MNQSKFLDDLSNNGYFIYENMLDNSTVESLKGDCVKWIDICGEYQENAGLTKDQTAHHSVGGKGAIDNLLHSHIFDPIVSSYFDKKKYILHACNPVLGPPAADSYLHKIHRDIQTFFPNVNMRINVLVALDDFTLENGATEILPSSHKVSSTPSKRAFNSKKISLCMPKGSVVFFNSYLWHRAGVNLTDKNRVALTLSYGLSFIKPQLDYARMLGDEAGRDFSDISRQVFGYNARVPVSLTEWYQKPESRFYHSDQG